MTDTLNLGQLDASPDAGLYSFRFEFAGTRHEVQPTVDAVLRFLAGVEAMGNQVAFDRLDVLRLATPLVGGEFDPEAPEFKAGEHGDLVPRLIEEGMDFGALEHLLNTVFCLFMWGREVAEEFIEVGVIQTAFTRVAERRAANTTKD